MIRLPSSSGPPVYTAPAAQLERERLLRFTYRVGSEERDGILLWTQRGPRAFRNLCPHWRLPLDNGGGEILDESAGVVFCDAHAAEFALDDGRCVSGPCEGQYLERLDAAIEGDTVTVRMQSPLFA